MITGEIKCRHRKPISECLKCYPSFLRETSVDEAIDTNRPGLTSYQGLTHGIPSWGWLMWLRRKILCPQKIHTYDEVWSSGRHYLSCDACGLEIHINRVNYGYVQQ